MIPMGSFDEWFKLYDWAQNNDKYELNFKEQIRERVHRGTSKLYK